MSSVKTIICDVDGVLTDSKVWYDHNGHKSKGFHSRDIRAIRELVANGFDVVLYTQSSWPGLENYAARTGATIIMNREKIPLQTPYIAIGDDIPDLEILNHAVRAFCPKDADPMVRSLHGITVLDCKGGEGCIAELLHHGIAAVDIKNLASDTETLTGLVDAVNNVAEAFSAIAIICGSINKHNDVLMPGSFQTDKIGKMMHILDYSQPPMPHTIKFAENLNNNKWK